MKRVKRRSPPVNPLFSFLKPPRRWWFVFHDQQAAGADWWEVFTRHRPGFGHVFALCEPSPDVTLIVNPQPGRVETLTIEGPPYHLLRQYGGGGCRVMVVEMAPSVVALVPRGWAVTCASYVAYAAGISFRGVTPFQLYRRIIKLGGEQVWEKQ